MFRVSGMLRKNVGQGEMKDSQECKGFIQNARVAREMYGICSVKDQRTGQ